MSLRGRLTVITTAVVLLAAVLLGGVFLLTASRIQYDSIDRNLRTSIATERINGLIQKPRSVPADVFNTVGVVLVDRLGAARVLRPAGYGSSPLALPALDAAAVEAARQGPVTLGGDVDFRALANAPNGRGDTIVALTPLTAVDDQLSALVRGVVLGIALVTIASGLIAWLVLGRALRPVVDMAEAAREIAEGDLERRVPTAKEGTELGQLSDALNVMIGSLTASLDEVRQSEALLREFVSDASHELRTPVTVIRGYSDLLGKESRDRSELEARALERIGAEVARLEHLIDQLLTLQSVAKSGRPQSHDSVDVLGVFTRVFGAFDDLNPDRAVTVTGSPAWVGGSDEEWTTVAGNLVQNIGRYTPSSGSVWVSVTPQADECWIAVDDDGPGIPPESRKRMLERFTRLDDSRSSVTGGTGLGLSIVRAIVERQGGSVALDDSPHGGLRVMLVLPLADDAVGVAPTAT